VQNAVGFREKLQRGQLCLGTCITFTDPAVTEALADGLDFLWIDTEHGALSLETVQEHLIAARGSGAAMLVRVAWNDPVLIKPVLDAGADGIIVPFVRSAEDVRRAVAACKYPPDGIRGYGPRRPSNYGRRGGPDYIRAANAAVLPIVQIEHRDAVDNLQEILAVPGLAALLIGPQDLAGSLGHPGEPQHTEVLRAIDTVLALAGRAAIPVGLAAGGEAEDFVAWARKGVRWLTVGGDFWLMVRALAQLTAHIRGALEAKQGRLPFDVGRAMDLG
jgi:2-dehydro-3-deoxyglucarate aldolase/4-hydroxy-2-oxoheptanedioate aldolase